MGAIETNHWHDANQQYLMRALGLVREALERHGAGTGRSVAGDTPPSAEPGVTEKMSDQAAEVFPTTSALEVLVKTLGLSPFERDVLLLCAGVELDSSFAALCAKQQGDPLRPYPTFSLALAALPGPHWSALTPAAPLRYWRLIEVGGSGSALTVSPLRIDERILHYLTGINHLDERLTGFVEPVAVAAGLVPSHRSLAERIAVTWSRAVGTRPLPAVQLCGAEESTQRAIAAMACAMLGLNLFGMPAPGIPLETRERTALIRLWERESALSASALLLECREPESSDLLREHAIERMIEETRGTLILSGRGRRQAEGRVMITFDVSKAGTGEQRTLWQCGLGRTAQSLNGATERLAAQFNLNTSAIRTVCAEALSRQTDGATRSSNDLEKTLWDACRIQSRPRLDDLAQRIESVATWEDLVLPEPQKQILHEIAIHVRQRGKVYEVWGFAAKGSRGLGISALFTGASGTGKTMAAEVLANELRLDLYHVDLSQVVSKYIGETEKNLRRVFEAAEGGGAILLFDEADALFGKRSEVKDSHDRYANIEVSYLLQRMESYRGLAILTTNLKEALDHAFLRRIRFVVPFPFPDAAQRAEIWKRIFPAGTPVESMAIDQLARLNVAGGNIRNIALHAAFLAAHSQKPVRMEHLLSAARNEYAKLEKPLTEAEIGGWV